MLFIVDPLVIPIERLAGIARLGRALCHPPGAPLQELSNQGTTKRGNQAGKPHSVCEKAGSEQKGACNQKTQTFYQRCRRQFVPGKRYLKSPPSCQPLYPYQPGTKDSCHHDQQDRPWRAYPGTNLHKKIDFHERND